MLDFYLGSSLVKQGDINGDNALDGGDYGVLDFVLGSQVYGPLGASVTGASPGVAAVPEPTSGALLVFGAAFISALRRKKQ